MRSTAVLLFTSFLLSIVQAKLRYHIAFGDSYTASTFDVNGAWPNAKNAMGNPAIGTETTTGGKNWLEYSMVKYNISEYYSFNFAYGGAVTDERIVSQDASTVLSATDQVWKEFLPHVAKSKTTWTTTNTLFSLTIGINDINRCILNGLSMRRTLPKILAQRKNITDTLYAAGARKFLFQNIPPLDRTPLVIADGANLVQQNQLWVTGYNNDLITFNTQFKEDYPDAVVYEYDLWQFFTMVLNSPQKYGFVDNSTVGTGDFPYMWWNTYHPGFQVHNLWAKSLAELF